MGRIGFTLSSADQRSENPRRREYACTRRGVLSIQNAVTRGETSLASLFKDISSAQCRHSIDHCQTVEPRICPPRSTFFDSRIPHAECQCTHAASDSLCADVARFARRLSRSHHHAAVADPAVARSSAPAFPATLRQHDWFAAHAYEYRRRTRGPTAREFAARRQRRSLPARWALLRCHPLSVSCSKSGVTNIGAASPSLI